MPLTIEKKDITLVGEYKVKRSWFAIDIFRRVVLTKISYSEINSKGKALLFRERTGKHAIEGSLTAYREVQFVEKSDEEKGDIEEDEPFG